MLVLLLLHHQFNTAYRPGLSASRFATLPQDALQIDKRGMSNDPKLSLKESFDLVKDRNVVSSDHTSEAWFHDYGQEAAVSDVGNSGTATHRDIRGYGYQSGDVTQFKFCLGLVSKAFSNPSAAVRCPQLI